MNYSLILLKTIVFCASLPSVFAVFSDSLIDIRIAVATHIESCFFFKVHQPNSKIEIEIQGGEPRSEVGYTLLDPNGKELGTASLVKKVEFTYPPKENPFHEIGDYQVCARHFSFHDSTVAIRVVVYEKNHQNIDVNSMLTRIMKNNFNEMIAKDKFENITQRIDEKLGVIILEQSKRAFIEKVDRSEIEKLYERVNFMGFWHTFVMVISAVSQVYFIRSLLSDNSLFKRIASLIKRRSHIY